MKTNFAKKIVKILTVMIFSVFVLTLFNSATVKAETNSNKYSYTLLQPLPGANETLSKDVTIEQYLTWAFRFTLALAGFLAVMMIVIGGVEYIISGANEKMRGEAHSRITNAIYGLVLALVAYLVLYTINPSLVDFENNSFLNKETTSSNNNNNNSADNSNSSYASDNPYVNKGESTTKLEQSSSAGSDQNNNSINDKFENPTGTTKNSQFQGTMKSVE